MGKHYDQFDLDDRIEISRLHSDGISCRAIGRMMGRSASTISRELRRNSLPKGGYKPASADRIALSRRRRLSRIERLGPLGDHVRDHLAMGVKGNLAIEKHIENPEDSDIFTMFPKVMGDSHAMQFLCDYLRLLTMGSDKPHELESLMDQDMETHHDEENAVVIALRAVADSLPAIGIIAAVLGVIKTMASITEPPEVLGYLIGAALVGTFLGILLSYGFVGPMAAVLSNIIDCDAKYYQCMKAGLLAHVSGQPPMIAVEFARKTLPADVRPNFYELEEAFDSLPPIAN